jgi:hypothetical protein
MIVHRAVQSGFLGGRDSWGFGCGTLLFDWPTLGIAKFAIDNPNGGCSFPVAQLCGEVVPTAGDHSAVRDADGRPASLPVQGWMTDGTRQRDCRRYVLSPDGRAWVFGADYSIIEYASEGEAVEDLS